MVPDHLGGHQGHGRAPYGDHVEAPDGDHAPQPGAGAELPPAVDEIGAEGAQGGAGGGAGGDGKRAQPEEQQAQRAERVGGGVRGEDPAGRGEAHQDAGHGRTGELGGGLGDADGAVGALAVGGEAGHGAGHAGLEDRAGHAVDDADGADLPQHHVPGEEQAGGDGLGAEPDEVGADHQPAGAEPVGDDPAEDDQSGERGGRGGHGEADRARAVPVFQQAGGEGDGQHGVAEAGYGPGHEEEREVPRPDRRGAGRRLPHTLGGEIPPRVRTGHPECSPPRPGRSPARAVPRPYRFPSVLWPLPAHRGGIMPPPGRARRAFQSPAGRPSSGWTSRSRGGAA